MLHVHFGHLETEVESPGVLFNNTYEDEWLTDETVKEMIRDIDKSEVLFPGIIDSPFLGKIPPEKLSSGVRGLIAMKYMPEKIYNGERFGDNCVKWILQMADEKDITITLNHLMDFSPYKFKIKIVNNDNIVDNYREFVLESDKFME